ncbi:MAG TPA: fumarylacetoacetate hydrolase family protein [Acidobacteriaceae bacterium]|jgi:2-dehydro-3-deoxy-D-arabinonate dehydratase|nr:fumarylacetoacetate hydrolase family protein [Acidobacteriaceae bacterium]
MKLYNTKKGIFANGNDDNWYKLDVPSWDDLISDSNLPARVRQASGLPAVEKPEPADLLPPIGNQEVWAAGVTYYRSRTARMDESRDAGGGTFYDRVYSAERPELFFKATARRVVGPGEPVRIRADAKWSVPEPELTLLIDPRGEIAGYTVGNDMSSRDIEGENPLYLPQAKVYEGSCALGPCVLLADQPFPKTTAISISIERSGSVAFEGRTTLDMLKRNPQDLADYLFRENTFPVGAYLMTGTGIVPDDTFTLAHGDVIHISIDGIGTLTNRVA